MRFTMNANRPMNSHDWNLVHAGPAACPVQRPKHRSVVRGASMLNSVCVATQVGDIYLSSRSSEPRSLRPWLNASRTLHIGHAQGVDLSRFPETHGHVDGRLAVSWWRNLHRTRDFSHFTGAKISGPAHHAVWAPEDGQHCEIELTTSFSPWSRGEWGWYCRSFCRDDRPVSRRDASGPGGWCRTCWRPRYGPERWLHRSGPRGTGRR